MTTTEEYIAGGIIAFILSIILISVGSVNINKINRGVHETGDRDKGFFGVLIVLGIVCLLFAAFTGFGVLSDDIY